ncbi:MAG: formylglycine-generating enzyme family protein [Magnetococcales bacterium]|nr:formylglycine-generating enzyme family protein [Magnetococcales bacterium]
MQQQRESQKDAGITVKSTLLDLQKGPTHSRAELPESPSFQVQSDCETLTFARLRKPDWADAIGRDRFGLWASFALPDSGHPPVRQILRWIPPGRFVMGSPEDEEGRYPDEGPQHEVTFSQGFWLFDTPCTQALWQAVMGNNPSRFRSVNRPVEQVNFADVQEFLQKMEEQRPGLGLQLPSEAQWEYACRAGSSTALYNGPMKILGERNAPALDAIAWYGGNSGKEFDLEQGIDSAEWEEKQYDHRQAGTRLVRLKLSNGWGLYDMLGNVWEWCQDHNHDSYQGAPPDGSAWLDSAASADAGRVVRGGSWNSRARRVRSAMRGWDEPADRRGYLGFRCVRVP